MLPPKIHTIIREEAARAGYTFDELLKDDRSLRITKVRQYAMWRARKETTRSLKEISTVFKRDHSCIVNAVHKFDAMSPEERLHLPPKPRIKIPRKPAQFIDGKPCPHGHGTRRYVMTRKCVECCKIRDKIRSKTRIRAKPGDQAQSLENG